jgi:hypothetical protein
MKTYNFEFDSDAIQSVSVRKSNSYNYVSVYIKHNDDYVNINYEWEGDKIPDFAMDIMAFITDKETASVSKEISSFIERLKCL